MKILLVCAGGMSTSILMKKMEKYWAEKKIPLSIEAVGIADYEEICGEYEMILVGPQVGYRLGEIKQHSGKPCAVINSTDYALGNCDAILKLAYSLLKS
jgi:PTS system cellobiose-specific IIB component